jgi:nitrite reductase/ring-hydroxylating ferredoxin subunit
MERAPAAGDRLCSLDAVSDPGAKGFEFRNGDFLFRGFVVRKGAAVFGYRDSCPHIGWPLALSQDQYLTRAGDLILCSGHGALFRLEDGVCVGGPCAGKRLAPWPVAVVGDEVRTA